MIGAPTVPEATGGEGDTLTALADKGLVPLHSILCTEELSNRASRQPDHEAENRALKSLVQALADSPGTILQTLADTILKVFKADSAGLSLLTKDEKRFYWPAIAGGWQPHIGGGTPREFGPCGDVLNCNAPLLFKHWERRYPYLLSATPPANEGLLVPFYVKGKAVGTIWAIAHSEHRKFDAEDLRQLQSLGQFASSAYQAVASQEALEKSHTELVQGGVQLDKAEASRELAEALVGQLHDENEQRKRAEETLRESEEFNRSIIENSPDCIKILDLKGTLLSMQCGQELLGIPDIRPFLNKSWIELWAGGEQPAVRAAVEGAAAGDDRNFVAFFRTFDGRPKWWDVAVRPILDANGRPVRLIAVSRDVTQRHQQEEALRASEARFRTLFNGVPVAIYSTDAAGTIQEFNSVAVELWGREPKRGDPDERYCASYRLHLPDGSYLPHDQTPVVAVLTGQVPVVRDAEVVIERPDGSRITVMVNIVPLRNDAGEITGIMNCFYDITERKRAEAQLHQNNNTFFNLIQNAPFGLYVVDAQFRLSQVSTASQKVFANVHPLIGRDYEEVTRTIWSDPFASETIAKFRHTLATGEPFAAPNTVQQRKDNMAVESYDWKIERMTLPNGEFGVVCYFYDVSERNLAAEALRQSEERFRTLFNLSSVAVYSIDASGVIQNFNLRAAELWGQSPAAGDTDQLFCGSHKLYRPDGTFMPHDRCPMATVVSGEIAEARDAEVLIERPDGSRITVIVNIRPVKNHRGEITGAINCFYDITERKKAEKYAEMLATLSRDLANATEEADIVKIAVDTVGRHLNGHRCYFIECLENQNRLIVSRNYVRDEAPSIAGELSLFDFGGLDWWHQFASGDFFVEDVSTHPLTRAKSASYAEVGVPSYAVQPFRRDGDWTVCLVVTERLPRKWTAYDLRTLEDVVARVWPMVERARLIHDVSRARDLSEQANVAKDMFLASLSHELRTPLSPVLLLAGEAITDPATSAANREVFATILKNVKLEARLIDDLLDVTRISYGKLALDLQLVDLHVVMADAIDTVRAELLEKKIVLTMELSPVRPFLRGDPVRLQQIFWNVLRNAGKFSLPGGEITVKSLILPNGCLRITIADQGVGMTKAELARVFTSFSQGDHAAGGGSHRFGGLGLGLSISRMLVESHGGTIRAESGGLDQGATFIVEFPLDHAASSEQTVTASPAPPPVAPSVAAGMPPRRILLVEDHKPTRIAMTHLLVHRKYEVVAAASLAEARAAVNRATFDLLISDLGLPDGSGNELMTELRARFGLKGIALTGYGSDEDVSRSRAAGFGAHLTKPVSIELLENALATVAAA